MNSSGPKKTMYYMGVQTPQCKGAILRGKSGQPRTCPVMSGGQFAQSNSMGAALVQCGCQVGFTRLALPGKYDWTVSYFDWVKELYWQCAKMLAWHCALCGTLVTIQTYICIEVGLGLGHGHYKRQERHRIYRTQVCQLNWANSIALTCQRWSFISNLWLLVVSCKVN